MLTGTLNAKGDTAEIENLLTALANARAEAFVDEDPKDLSAYGLDPPALKVIIKSGGADPPQILLIGSRDGNKKYYAKTGDGKTSWRSAPA